MENKHMGISKRYSCIFCKYKKYNKNNDYGCMDTWEKDEYGYPMGKCNSLSNIYYGKLIRYFPFNLLYEIRLKIDSIKAKKYYDDFNEDFTENSTMKHIWGIKSYDDLSDAPCGFMTMNDFDITYLKDKKKYILSVELIYYFERGYEDEKAYLNDILDKFTAWMVENHYDTEQKIRLWQFGDISLHSEFNSIEEAYAAFKYMIKGF